MLALEGKQLGNYDVTRRIRVGGMGAVYEGKQRTAFGRRVAIKVILGNYAADPEMRRRFAREARTIARLHHPHILPLIEFGDAQGVLYLVMPFIEGGTLTSYLRRALPGLSEVAAIFTQLLDAVEYAHEQGLIHRDIKSSNVLLELRRSGPPYAYLADFGLVRTRQQAELEHVGEPIPLDQVPGTPHYMAPEQTLGIVTTSTDIYALGVLLYQMLTGELPYDDPDEVSVIKMHLHAPIPTPCEHDASIPVQVGEVVRTAMAKQPEERFRTVGEFRTAFLAAVDTPILPVKDDVVRTTDDLISFPHRPASKQLVGPAPMLVRQRVRRMPTSGPLRQKQVQRNTDAVKGRRKRFTRAVVAAMLVPVLFLVLLIMPRTLGVSIFPVGFPLLGVAPNATVTITPLSKAFEDTYILQASPRVTAPDLSKRVVPDRLVVGYATVKRVTQTTGTRLIPAVQASGTVLFANNSGAPVSVSVGMIFVANTGVQIRTTQSVTVPAKQDEQNGTASAHAVAVEGGSSGNIPGHALATTCCGGQVSVSNVAPFSGGVDASAVHVVAQADLEMVKNALASGLGQQALQQIKKQFSADDMLVGSPTYATKVTSSSPPGTQVGQVQVQIDVLATVPVYNSEIVHRVAAQLLNKQASLTLGSSYLVQGIPTVVATHIVQQEQDGSFYLSVFVRGTWVYHLTPEQMSTWSQFIKGASPALAGAYLKSQVGVADVQIHLPFGTDHLPASANLIQIVVSG